MVAFRFLYLGLLIGTALALPVYPRSRIDEVITLREPASDHPPDIFPFEAGPQPPPAPPRTDRTVHFGDVSPLFCRQLKRVNTYFYLSE